MRVHSGRPRLMHMSTAKDYLPAVRINLFSYMKRDSSINEIIFRLLKNLYDLHLILSNDAMDAYDELDFNYKDISYEFISYNNFLFVFITNSISKNL